MELVNKITGSLSKLRTYWKEPMPGRYMPFKEIAAYSGGGIGAYILVTLGSACLLGVGNVLLSSTLGVDPNDMYILYVMSVVVNIFLTGVRANIIDNTRNKAGKYRPYIVTMAIPAAIACNLMVWFPYESFGKLLGPGEIFGETKTYVAKCALILFFNLILNFCYYFFYDAYENLIHVLSPDSQERADVSAIKSVVYSFAPSVINLITPIVAGSIFKTNLTDVRVYRLMYPIMAVIGILLLIVVYANTKEKIVQARTRVIQIRFIDAFKEVAKNKYFWIISFADWVSFLELAYYNILYWLYSYGGACSGRTYGIIVTVYGNASLWGMLLAPVCIRKYGKKAVLVVTNLFNIVFILSMLPFVREISNSMIWLVMGCLYLNQFMSSFFIIINPAIQADVRDYQQYKSGERIDGSFMAVKTIGTVVTLITTGVLPFIYEKGGITKEMAKTVMENKDVMSRIMPDGKTVKEILVASGQFDLNNPNAYTALYDPKILLSLVSILIIFSAIGAVLNVIPFFWYDFNERKQKSVIRVLKIRAMFEDYNNGALQDEALIEGVEIIKNAREMFDKEPKIVSKNDYKSVKDPEERKKAKAEYKNALEYNEEIEIAKFVCEELDKYGGQTMQKHLEANKDIYKAGLDGLKNADILDINSELAKAKAMSADTKQEREIRRIMLSLARRKRLSYRTIKKYYPDKSGFVEPDMDGLHALLEQEDKLEKHIKELYVQAKTDASKKQDIKQANTQRKTLSQRIKEEMDVHAYFGRAAKIYIDAERMVKQAENYSRLDEIFSKYDEVKAKSELVEA